MDEKIKDGARVTLKHIAAHASVSPSTVSLVLRNSPLVADRTREDVRISMNTLGYVYNRGAANLRSRRSHTIGLVVCEITNPFYAEFVAGVEGVMHNQDWIAFLANTNETVSRQDRFIHRMREQNVDGIVLTAVEETDPGIIEQLMRWNLPCVQALRRVGTFDADYVGPDYISGVALAIEHLLERGHRHIAFVGGDRQIAPVFEKLIGFRETLVRNNLTPGPHIACPSTREAGVSAVKEMLSMSNPPTAAICYNDVLAMGVVLGLQEAGKAPGSEFSVIGFDNTTEGALSSPSLTTIGVDPLTLGRAAADLILRRIEAPNGKPEQIILPSELIVRNT